MNISVIIPLYNKEKQVGRALDSVLQQTSKPGEIIVVNDGSTDESLAVVKGCSDDRIKIINQTNKGVSAARNRGVAESKGELIAFLDADDQWLPEYLETMLGLTQRYPEAGALGAAYVNIMPDGAKIYPGYRELPECDGVIKNYFSSAVKSKTNPLCIPATVIPRNVFEEVKGFPQWLNYDEDGFILGRIALRYPMVFLNRVMLLRHLDSPYHLSRNLEIIEDFPLAECLEIDGVVLDNETEFYFQEYCYKRYLNRLSRSIDFRDTEKAKIFLTKAKHTKLSRKRFKVFLFKYRKLVIKNKFPQLYLCLRGLRKGFAYLVNRFARGHHNYNTNGR